MKQQWERGFTIIEVILFLGITGVLFAALIVGVNANINQQRYNESVGAYKSLVNAQYDAVEHPRNDRDNSWVCTSNGGVQRAANGSGAGRGASDCVILGRYLEIHDGGTSVETGDVIGIQPNDSQALLTDGDALTAYIPKLSPINVEHSNIQWQSVLQGTNKQPSQASFLILRSPVSGLTRTFASNEPLHRDNLSTDINNTTALASIKTCIVGIARPIKSISVVATVASSNGVVLNGNDETC